VGCVGRELKVPGTFFVNGVLWGSVGLGWACVFVWAGVMSKKVPGTLGACWGAALRIGY